MIAAISGTVSLVAIPANILAEPVVAAATIAGFGAALTAPILMPMGQFLAALAGLPCRWLVWVASWFGTLPGALLPWPTGLVGGLSLLAVIGVVWALAWRPRRRIPLLAMAVTALIVQIPIRSVTSGWPPGGEVFVACDVGQGDALLLPTGPGSAVVVDTGPDPVLVDRCLQDQRVTEVPLLVLTHDHVDHVGGIAGVLRGRRVGRVIAGPLAEPESGAALVADALRPRHLQAEPASVGLGLRVGTVTLEVLGPPHAFRGTRSDPNNSSLVLRAESHRVRILLPGDAEIEAQQQLLAAGADVASDVLKVPHHGSAYSDHSLLAAVHARLAVISVGAHNDYGQPAPSLLGELDRLGMLVRRTDRDGDVAVTWTDGRLGTQIRHALGVAQSGGCRPTGRSRGCGSRADLAADGWPIAKNRADRQAQSLVSAVHATMSVCRTLPRTSPAGCSLMANGRHTSFWSSATRSSSWRAPSSRSPPPCVGVDPSTDIDERAGGQVEPAELFDLLSPSLFGGRRILVISAAQDLRTAALTALGPFLDASADDTTIVLGARGRRQGQGGTRCGSPGRSAADPCARLTRAEERLEFIRGEVRRAGGSITPDAAALLLDAVGSDLRELAQAADQLVADSGGRVSADTVTAYYRGRAEVSGFAVSDRAVVGDTGGALETLRWALSIGTPAVVVADAMAEGVRSVARISAAGRGNPYQLAQRLGMPPWKVKRAQSQARCWTDDGLHDALQVVHTAARFPA